MGGTKADADRVKELEKLPHVKAGIKKMRDKQSAQSKAGQSRNWWKHLKILWKRWPFNKEGRGQLLPKRKKKLQQ